MDENFRSHRLFRIGRYDCRKRCEVLDLGGQRTYQFYTGGSDNLRGCGGRASLSWLTRSF